MDFLAVVLIIAIMGVVIYKRHVFDKQAASRGALDSAAMNLKNSIEMTAELMIERIQEQADQLTFIINEADVRINALDERIKKVDELLSRSEVSELKKASEDIRKALTEEKAKLQSSSEQQSELNKRIFALLDKGFDAEHISKTTGVGKGAVLLIEQMYRNMNKV